MRMVPAGVVTEPVSGSRVILGAPRMTSDTVTLKLDLEAGAPAAVVGNHAVTVAAVTLPKMREPMAVECCSSSAKLMWW